MPECQPVQINAICFTREREEQSPCLVSAKRWGVIAGYILQGKFSRGSVAVIATVRARRAYSAASAPAYAIAEATMGITKRVEQALAAGAGEVRLLIPFARKRKAFFFLELSSRRLRGKMGGLDYGVCESEEVLSDPPEEQVSLMLQVSQVRLANMMKKSRLRRSKVAGPRRESI